MGSQCSDYLPYRAPPSPLDAVNSDTNSATSESGMVWKSKGSVLFYCSAPRDVLCAVLIYSLSSHIGHPGTYL